MKPKTKIALTLCGIVAANIVEKYKTTEVGIRSQYSYGYREVHMEMYFKDSPMDFYRKINPLPEVHSLFITFDPTVRSPTTIFLVGEYRFCINFKGKPYQQPLYLYPTRIRRALLSGNNLEISPNVHFKNYSPFVLICLDNM